MKKCATVMVVDDEETVLNLVQRTLEKAGYNVVTATNGKEALDKVLRGGIGLILLDIRMPGLDGFQVLGLIRQHSNIPVIMLTGLVEETSLRDALNNGADDYITKPFKPRELVARIEAKLRRAGWKLRKSRGYQDCRFRLISSVSESE